MIPSNTICVSQEGPANALALNKDSTQVVIAGRNVFKVFAIGENDFTEVCNLRVGKNLNLNFSSIDVAWSSIEENTLATAATNGAVVVWNLGRSGRSKQEHVFSDHKRTVNKVSFHLTEPSLLISGSQDGMMKCFDLRIKEVARTFISNTESIRDVQFSPHQANTFAAVSENGNVQIWDVRRHERCLLQYTAHSGPVFACDWHPELPWLATASRDKTIKVEKGEIYQHKPGSTDVVRLLYREDDIQYLKKVVYTVDVWDVATKPNLEHTIYTIASVGHVKWRPQKKYQVSSCALVLDCAVHVWDVRRPHVPLATFAEHRDVATALAWLATPHAFLSTSRDCTLYRHRFSEAAHPVLWANPHGVCVSARGEVAHATPARPLPALPSRPALPDRHLPALGRKQPTAGSLCSSAQAALEALFPLGAAAALRRHVARAPAHGAPAHAAHALAAAAARYRLRGQDVHVLATHNAQVAKDLDRHMVSHVWEIVRCVYACRAGGRRSPAPARPAPLHPDPPPLPPYHYTHSTSSTLEEETMEEVEDWHETQFHNSGVLGKPTLSIYIPPSKHAKHARAEEGSGWVSAASAHYVDVEAAEWALPEEAFPLRPAHPHAHPHPPAHPHAHPHAPPQHAEDKDSHPSRRVVAAGGVSPGGSGGSGGSGSSGGSSSPGSGSSGSACTAPPNLDAYQNNINVEEGEGGLAVRVSESSSPSLDLAPLLAAALQHHADLGDVQTAAVVLIVLQEYRSDLFPYIDEGVQEHWLLGYIELLQRHKLWNVATEVIRCAWVSSVWVLSQQSTVVALCCGRCGRRARAHAPCDACAAAGGPRALPDLCAVCRQVVRGLYAWCQGCAHGGHLQHMRSWLQQHRLCPAGCGHACELG